MLRWLRWWLITGLTLAFTGVPVVQAEPAVVRAVLFYSPSCGHCHMVMTETLPLLIEKYREQLHIIGIDVTESFVIGATCAWCLTSAILMTALLWLTVTPRRLALIKHGSTS